MNDEQAWAPPAGAAPASGVPAPPGVPPDAPPSWGPAAPTGPAGWTPPPKPGLVPLRPMTLGTILTAVFQVMRRNPMPTFGLSLLLYGVGGLLSIGVAALVIWVVTRTGSGAVFGAADSTGVANAIVVAVAVVLGVLVVNLITASLVQGVVVLEVASGTLGERLRVAGLWRRLRPRRARMLGWLALQSTAVAVALGVLVALIVALSLAGPAGIASAVLLGLLGGLAIAALAVWTGIKLVFVVPAIVLEQRRIGDAVRRSWSLTRGHFWRSLGILALIWLIYAVAGQVVSVPLSLIGGLGTTLISGGGTDPQLDLVSNIVFTALSTMLGFVVGAIGLVMTSATVGLLYIDTRMRKEGLDQDLLRAAEHRAAGDLDSDPYQATRSESVAPGSP